MTENFYISCPHCHLLCEIKKSDINCGIFRHAVFKQNMQFVPPHASKEECERWLENDLVFGCAKPFKFDGSKAEKCDYI